MAWSLLDVEVKIGFVCCDDKFFFELDVFVPVRKHGSPAMSLPWRDCRPRTREIHVSPSLVHWLLEIRVGRRVSESRWFRYGLVPSWLTYCPARRLP